MLIAPLFTGNPRAAYLAQKDEIDEAIAQVLNGASYVLGPHVEKFEKGFADFIGCKYALGVANGTDAVELALIASGLKPGDEVLTVSHTAVASVAAIRRAGGIPVFVDIDPDFYTMDPASLEAAITTRSRAVLLVHIYGGAADIDPVLQVADRHGLFVVEDCAQSFGGFYKGHQLGSFAAASAFSFYPTKNLGALGDGGAVATTRSEIAERVRQLRQYGWTTSQYSETDGWNSRLDELQAAVLSVKLSVSKRNLNRRSEIAQHYQSGLSALPIKLPAVRADCIHAYHLYVIRTLARDDLKKHMAVRGVHAGVHYPYPVHTQPAYASNIKLPVTEQAAKEILSLPLYPEMQDADISRVVDSVRSFFV